LRVERRGRDSEKKSARRVLDLPDIRKLPHARASASTAEASYGRLTTEGNHPTGNQNGTGERVGFSQDASRGIWGLPRIITRGGATLARAPSALYDARPADKVGFPRTRSEFSAIRRLYTGQ